MNSGHPECRLLTDCQQHIPYLAKIWYEQLGRHWNPQATPEGAAATLLKHLNSVSLPLTLVAHLDGQPVGMASLRENDGLDLELTPWLGSLVVDPDCRGRGVGEALIENIRQTAIELGHTDLYLFAYDPTLPEWYARLGWRVIGHERHRGHPVIVMGR